MARRTDVDWEAIEADYRIGALSLRQMADKHGVHKSAITRKANKDAWPRDLSKLVEAGTKAALIDKAKKSAQAAADALESAHQSAQQSAHRVLSGVDAAVSQRVAVLSKHQDAVAESVAAAISLQRELIVASMSVPELKAIAAAVKDSEPSLAKDLMALAQLPTRAMTAKTIVDTLAKAITTERQAHGITDNDGGANEGNDIDALLLRVDEHLRQGIAGA